MAILRWPKQSWILASAMPIMALLLATIAAADTNITSTATASAIPPTWTYALPKKQCPQGGNDCFLSSPVLADITGDDFLEIIIGTNNGFITVLNHDGSLLWQTDLASYFGMSPGTLEIASSPAVGDIDKDGYQEIVVGVGTIYNRNTTQGGVIALTHNGVVELGWPQLAVDTNGNGFSETIYGTPALGDLTKDGYLEIVVGGFDKRIYAWRYDGTLLPGFPADSYLSERFPDWGLNGILADTIWSSPALADIDGDSFIDIVIGTDEGNFDSRWGGNAEGWSCPYALPAGWADGYCGGSLYALDRFGRTLPGFPKYILEIMQSTPALTDLDYDGTPEIFVGTGTFYNVNSSNNPTDGYRLFGWNGMGNELVGWTDGQPMSGTSPASPAVGDIDGDGDPEIVALGMDSLLYAWHHNGQTVSNFPMQPKDDGDRTFPFNVGVTPILADYTGNGAMEIFISTIWSITVVDGGGNQLTVSKAAPGKPFYYANGLLRNTPAIGDIDNDGELEMVVHNSTLYVWDLEWQGVPSNGSADWPMFKHNAARTSYPTAPKLAIIPDSVTQFHEVGDSNDVHVDLQIKNLGNLPFDWSISSKNSVSFAPNNGSITDEAEVTVTIPRSSLVMGPNHRTIDVVGTHSGEPVANSPQTVTINVVLAESISTLYLPLITR